MSWRLPSDSILPPPEVRPVPSDDLSARLLAVLGRLGVPATISRTIAGPTTIAWELKPGPDVRMRDFSRDRRVDDIAYALGAETVRIQAPIPGEQLVGIEVPSPSRRVVSLSELLDVTEPPLTAGLGIASDLTPLALNIASLPHLMVAGASGSGKSSLLHTIVCSLLMRTTPEELRLLLVDLKRTELGRYDGIPHLVSPPVDEADRAIGALENLASEIERREALLAKRGVQDLDAYNRVAAEKLPRILCVVDEFAELMLQSSKRVETAVVRIGQLGRACGVHLVLATQSPHQQVFSGLIKANVPARIALRVTSGTHSRVALDQGGAEELLGRGDALLQDGTGVKLRRFQAAFVPAAVIDQVVEHWREQAPRPIPPQPPRRFRPTPRPVATTPGRRAPTLAPPARRSPSPAAARPRRRPERRPEARPKPRRSLRRRAVPVALLAVIGLCVYLAFLLAPNPGGCPGNSVYENTSREEICTLPSGKVVCTIGSFGFSPTRNGNPPGVDYASVAPGPSPWCSNARQFNVYP